MKNIHIINMEVVCLQVSQQTGLREVLALALNFHIYWSEHRLFAHESESRSTIAEELSLLALQFGCKQIYGLFYTGGPGSFELTIFLL